MDEIDECLALVEPGKGKGMTSSGTPEEIIVTPDIDDAMDCESETVSQLMKGEQFRQITYYMTPERAAEIARATPTRLPTKVTNFPNDKELLAPMAEARSHSRVLLALEVGDLVPHNVWLGGEKAWFPPFVPIIHEKDGSIAESAPTVHITGVELPTMACLYDGDAVEDFNALNEMLFENGFDKLSLSDISEAESVLLELRHGLLQIFCRLISMELNDKRRPIKTPLQQLGRVAEETPSQVNLSESAGAGSNPESSVPKPPAKSARRSILQTGSDATWRDKVCPKWYWIYPKAAPEGQFRYPEYLHSEDGPITSESHCFYSGVETIKKYEAYVKDEFAPEAYRPPDTDGRSHNPYVRYRNAGKITFRYNNPGGPGGSVPLKWYPQPDPITVNERNLHESKNPLVLPLGHLWVPMPAFTGENGVRYNQPEAFTDLISTVMDPNTSMDVFRFIKAMENEKYDLRYYDVIRRPFGMLLACRKKLTAAENESLGKLPNTISDRFYYYGSRPAEEYPAWKRPFGGRKLEDVINHWKSDKLHSDEALLEWNSHYSTGQLEGLQQWYDGWSKDPRHPYPMPSMDWTTFKKKDAANYRIWRVALEIWSMSGVKPVKIQNIDFLQHKVDITEAMAQQFSDFSAIWTGHGAKGVQMWAATAKEILLPSKRKQETTPPSKRGHPTGGYGQKGSKHQKKSEKTLSQLTAEISKRGSSAWNPLPGTSSSTASTKAAVPGSAEYAKEKEQVMRITPQIQQDLKDPNLLKIFVADEVGHPIPWTEEDAALFTVTTRKELFMAKSRADDQDIGNSLYHVESVYWDKHKGFVGIVTCNPTSMLHLREFIPTFADRELIFRSPGEHDVTTVIFAISSECDFLPRSEIIAAIRKDTRLKELPFEKGRWKEGPRQITCHLTVSKCESS